MLLPASYVPLPPGLYDIPFANVLYRPANTNGGWYDGGDVDSFSLNITATKKQRYGKNASTSYLAHEATTRVEAAATGKFMQKTNYIRAASLLGKAYKVEQIAGPVEYPISDLVAGMFYAVGNYGVSGITMKYMKGAQLAAMPLGSFRLVDAALGVVQVLNVPGDATPDQNGKVAGSISGTVSADDADVATRIDATTQSSVDLEVMVRNVSDEGPKGYYHIFNWLAAPDGEMGLITAQEDFEGVTIKGRCSKTTQGVAYWQSLAA